jgi:acetyl esterase/lipase
MTRGSVRFGALRISAIALLAIATAPAQKERSPTFPATSSSDPITTNAGAAHKDVVYSFIGHGKLKLDVYQPKSPSASPLPGIILIHGGSWEEGDKTELAAMARYLASNGYVAFSIDYRLHSGGKNRWPAQLDDAQRAVRWVRRHAADYNVDPKRIGAWGYSAGGQMASLLGEIDTRDNSDPELAKYSSRVQAVVDVSGPADFTSGFDTDGGRFFNDLFGATKQQNPELWKSASPVFNISKQTVPFLIVHGTRDGTVPIAQSVEFANALHKAGIDVSLVQLDMGHDIDTEAAKRQIAVETVQFFDRTLGRRDDEMHKP